MIDENRQIQCHDLSQDQINVEDKPEVQFDFNASKIGLTLVCDDPTQTNQSNLWSLNTQILDFDMKFVKFKHS